jgi:ribonuclease HI
MGSKTTSSKKKQGEQKESSKDTQSNSKGSQSSSKEESTTKPKKSSRRSVPRGRKGASMEPANYTYNRLLIYSDGAARGNPGEAGAGVVLKTPEGEEVGRFGRYLGRFTNNVAEYEAVLLGLSQAKEFGATDVTILSDSDLLVRQLLGEYKVRAEHLKVLYDQVKEELEDFSRFQVKRIPREKNADADSMANRAIDEKL